MARPKRGNYATGAAGQAKYVAALKKHLDNVAKAKKARTITSTKKNIEKQKTAAKKTTSTKVKELAKKTTTTAKKTTAKKPVASKTVAKTTATKTPVTKTVTRTKAKTTPKKLVAKKPVAKKPVAKKPAGKVPAKKPLISSKNKLRIKKAATTARKTTVKTAKTVAKKAGNLKNTVTKKVDALKKVKQTKAPRPTTPQQKFVSKAAKNIKKYGGKVKDKLGKDLVGKKGILKIRNIGSGIRGGVAGLATAGLTSAINTRVDRAFAKRKGMTLQEFNAAKQKMKNNRNIVKSVKNIASKIRGKSNTQSSTTKNINKQKKTNNNLSARNISKNKNKKNFYNTPDGKSPKAKEIANVQKNIKKAKGVNKELLQKKLNYLQKFGKMSSFTVDKNSKSEREARRINKSLPTTSAASKSPKPGSARAKLRAKNEARFGKAHVDKLRAKNKDFQAMKKKKLTKTEFIKRYPNSQTAKRARGM